MTKANREKKTHNICDVETTTSWCGELASGRVAQKMKEQRRKRNSDNTQKHVKLTNRHLFCDTQKTLNKIKKLFNVMRPHNCVSCQSYRQFTFNLLQSKVFHQITSRLEFIVYGLNINPYIDSFAIPRCLLCWWAEINNFSILYQFFLLFARIDHFQDAYLLRLEKDTIPLWSFSFLFLS